MRDSGLKALTVRPSLVGALAVNASGSRTAAVGSWCLAQGLQVSDIALGRDLSISEQRRPLVESARRFSPGRLSRFRPFPTCTSRSRWTAPAFPWCRTKPRAGKVRAKPVKQEPETSDLASSFTQVTVDANERPVRDEGSKAVPGDGAPWIWNSNEPSWNIAALARVERENQVGTRPWLFS